MQGAALVTEQREPDASIVDEQQSLASSPAMLPHPAPPHWPQAARQHMSLSSMPARPLLQVEFVSVTAVKDTFIQVGKLEETGAGGESCEW